MINEKLLEGESEEGYVISVNFHDELYHEVGLEYSSYKMNVSEDPGSGKQSVSSIDIHLDYDPDDKVHARFPAWNLRLLSLSFEEPDGSSACIPCYIAQTPRVAGYDKVKLVPGNVEVVEFVNIDRGDEVLVPLPIRKLAGEYCGTACEYIETLSSGESEVAYLRLNLTCSEVQANDILSCDGWIGNCKTTSIGVGRSRAIRISGKWNPDKL